MITRVDSRPASNKNVCQNVPDLLQRSALGENTVDIRVSKLLGEQDCCDKLDLLPEEEVSESTFTNIMTGQQQRIVKEKPLSFGQPLASGLDSPTELQQQIKAVEAQRAALDQMILEKQAVIASLYKYKDNLQNMLNNIGQTRVKDPSAQSMSSFASPENSQQEESRCRSKDEIMEDQGSDGDA